MEVPLPLAASRDLINFLTFQISTFLSEVSAVDSDISKYNKIYLKENNSFKIDKSKLSKSKVSFLKIRNYRYET